MEIIKLPWEGPFSFQSLLKDEELRNEYSCSGVYIWKEGSDIAYVGKTKSSLIKRQLEHYLGYLGGTYTIPEQFTHNNIEWKLLDLKISLNVIIDLERFKKRVEDGYKYANSLEIYMAKAAKEEVAAIERNLLYQLQPTRTDWGKKTKPKNILEFEHCGDLSL